MALVINPKILGSTAEMFGIECTVQNCAKKIIFGSLDKQVMTRFFGLQPNRMAGQPLAHGERDMPGREHDRACDTLDRSTTRREHACNRGRGRATGAQSWNDYRDKSSLSR